MVVELRASAAAGQHLPEATEGIQTRLRCHLNRGVEIYLLRGSGGPHGAKCWPWNRKAILPEPTHVQLDGNLNASQRRIKRLAGCHTPGEVRNRRTPVASRFLVDADEVSNPLHFRPRFMPAWRRTGANVPFGMSSPRPPLTVTRPGVVGTSLRRRRVARRTGSIVSTNPARRGRAPSNAACSRQIQEV